MGAQGRSAAAESLEPRVCLSDASVLAFSTGTARGVEMMVSADFNGDGHNDLAGVLPLHDSVVVLLNNGDGTFGKPTYYHISAPRAIAFGDFNRDGKLDLAVAGTFRNHDAIDLLLGNGDGTFTLGPNRLPVHVGGFSLVAGDFNNDGATDLAITTQASVGVLLNNGDGTFARAVYYPIGGKRPTDLVTGDFNGDGVLDFAVARGQKNAVTVLLGNKSVPGTFGPPTAFPAGVNPDGLVAGDFNGDGKLDLAVVNSGFHIAGLSVLLGNGDGTFRPSSAYSGTGDFSDAITATDFNGDGKTDLVVASFTTSLKLFAGNGDGTFAPPITIPGGQHAQHVLASDFNGDGKPDLAVTPGNGVRIILNGVSAPPPGQSSSTDIALGNGQPASTTFTAPDGTQITVSLRGPGAATVHLTGTDSLFRLSSISATGTTAATTLSIVTHGGSRTATIGSITSDGAFASISAPTTNLTGALSVPGGAGNISLLSANGGSITTGAGAGTLSLLLGQTAGETITSAQPINLLHVDQDASLTLTAPSIARLTVARALRDSQVSLTTPFSAGALDLGALSAGGGITNSAIRSAGSIGTVTARGMISSTIYAGVGPLAPGQSLPTAANDFVAPASIASVRLTHPATLPAFANSVIAAQTLGTLSLSAIQTANGGAQFGVAAHEIRSLAGTDLTSRRAFQFTNLSDPAALAALLAAKGLNLQDFVIRLL